MKLVEKSSLCFKRLRQVQGRGIQNILSSQSRHKKEEAAPGERRECGSRRGHQSCSDGELGAGVVLLTSGLIKVWIHVLGLGTWSPTSQQVPGTGEVVGNRGTEGSEDILRGSNRPGELPVPSSP